MKELSSKERVNYVLQGKIPDRLPVIPQGFMFSMKTAGYSIGEVNRNPAKMAESHILSLEKYGYDGCVVDVDDATLAEACGAKVVFRDKDVATVDEHHPVLKDLREIVDLKIPEPLKDGRISQWLETVERIKSKVGNEFFVMGRADQGPFSLLGLLRGMENFMYDLVEEDTEVIMQALEWATEAHTRFAKAQFRAGADASSMGDSYASSDLVSPEIYKKFAFPFERKVVSNLEEFNKPYSIHICGNASKIIKEMGQTEAEILEIDWKTDMGFARQSVPEKTVLMGNVDPSDVMVNGDPAKVRSKVRDIIGKTKGKGIIISSGCALGANTRPENMEALVESSKLYATYEQLAELQKNQ